MNQSILFNQDAEWQEQEQRVAFTALLFGQVIFCYISRQRLAQLADESRQLQDWLAVFEANRLILKNWLKARSRRKSLLKTAAFAFIESVQPDTHLLIAHNWLLNA